MDNEPNDYILFQKLKRDLKNKTKTLSKDEARYLVDLYYQMQHHRITSESQIRAINQGHDSGETHELLTFFSDKSWSMEREIQSVLGSYALQFRVGRWLQSICGIGPVISAGILANVDIERAPYAGHLWSYAGILGDSLNNWDQSKWKQKENGKGKQKPWNSQFKTLVVFKAGESFVKVQNKDNDVYGHIYRERKDIYISKNLNHEYSERAKTILEKKKFNSQTEAKKAYESGRLPDAHIHAMARRWAVKVFLSHLHQVMFEDCYSKPAPRPYMIDIVGHYNLIECPNWPCE